MIKNVLQEIGGLGIYALTSLLLFFAVFSSALIWTLFQRRSLCVKMSALPLEEESGPNDLKGDNSHE